MDQVREVLRYYNYALKTEQAYCQWILRCVTWDAPKCVTWDAPKKLKNLPLHFVPNRSNDDLFKNVTRHAT